MPQPLLLVGGILAALTLGAACIAITKAVKTPPPVVTHSKVA